MSHPPVETHGVRLRDVRPTQKRASLQEGWTMFFTIFIVTKFLSI